MEPSYQILSYSDENLIKALTTSFVSEEKLVERNHFKYFQNYLSEDDGIGAKTILIELDYISKAYLIDYSNYYSTCFQDYGRKCKRVHFFDASFNKKKFEKELLDSTSNFLNDHYLGYIVIKPLMDSIIGPTLLKTYEERNDGKKRYYPGCRPYKVHLFGHEFEINSLAYQEQDTVVAACASVAIWSAFHKTSNLFDTQLPSPSEITKRAGNLFLNYGRTYPNPGLDIGQICKAIESVGLVSEVLFSRRFLSEIFLAKRLVYAYSRAGLPVLLFMIMDDGNGHLITINGHSDVSIKRSKSKEMSLYADAIEKFYAHDDQIGPFARIKFLESDKVETSWWDDEGNTMEGAIHSVTIPVYPKIRIKFQDVFDKVSLIDTILFQANLFQEEIEWDIYLTESNAYKNDILQGSYTPDIKQRIIFKHYPRYIWVARAMVKDSILFDFIYDSTDIATGHFGIDFILHEPLVQSYLKDNFKKFKSIYVDHRGGPKLGDKLYTAIMQELG